MLRIEITRRILVKQGKGRNRINPVSVIHEATMADALAEIARWQIQDDDSATMPFAEARIYDNAAFLAHLRSVPAACFNPTPLRIISAEG